MKSIDEWINEYGESHQNPTNKAIHWICVPLIMLSLLALIEKIPFRTAHQIVGNLVQLAHNSKKLLTVLVNI